MHKKRKRGNEKEKCVEEYILVRVASFRFAAPRRIIKESNSIISAYNCLSSAQKHPYHIGIFPNFHSSVLFRITETETEEIYSSTSGGAFPDSLFPPTDDLRSPKIPKDLGTIRPREIQAGPGSAGEDALYCLLYPDCIRDLVILRGSVANFICTNFFPVAEIWKSLSINAKLWRWGDLK